MPHDDSEDKRRDFIIKSIVSLSSTNGDASDNRHKLAERINSSSAVISFLDDLSVLCLRVSVDPKGGYEITTDIGSRTGDKVSFRVTFELDC
jgi:hypothetical protein